MVSAGDTSVRSVTTFQSKLSLWQEERHSKHHEVPAPLSKEKALKIRSLNFAPIYNELYNDRRSKHTRKRFAVMAYILPPLVGVASAFIAGAVGKGSHWLAKHRVELILSIMRSGNWFLAWLASFSMMLSLAFAGALPVIFWQRGAGSSGIPIVIALLNGCDLREEFTWKVLLVKTWGVTCAVSSGLIAGPEGPMIFIGACIGALFSKIPAHPTTWRYLGTPPSALNVDVFLRDYTAIGAGCGVAAAFRAPIAGTLFVIEEAASHFNRSQLCVIFMSSLIATGIAYLISSEMLEYPVVTGEGCALPKSLLWVAAMPIGIGMGGGALGAFFNHVNVEFAKIRAKHISGVMWWRRFTEVVVVVFVTSIIVMALPLIFSHEESRASVVFRRSSGCIRADWQSQLLKGSEVWYQEDGGGTGTGTSGGFAHHRRLRLTHTPESFEAQFAMKYVPRGCLYGAQEHEFNCPRVWQLCQQGNANACSCTQGFITPEVIERWREHGTLNYTFYCCNFNTEEEMLAGLFQTPNNASCDLYLGHTLPSLDSEGGHHNVGEASAERSLYSPMAGLTLVPLAEVANNLFTRGAPYVVPLPSLLIFLPLVFFLGAFTSGIALPSGLLLPQIVCGAVVGRIISLIAVEIQVGLNSYSRMNEDNSMWSPKWVPFFSYGGGPLDKDVLFTDSGFVDPGIGAVVGAAAFLGGCGRITLFVTIMMVEITGDPLMILPVGLGTVVAVLVANWFNHGLYHTLMYVASFPYLPEKWPAKHLPGEHLLRVLDVIEPDRPVVTVPLSGVREEVEAALETNNFGGFPVVSKEGTAVGVAERRHLVELLGGNSVPQRDMLSLADLLEDGVCEVDVGSVTDFHSVTVRQNLPLEVAYQLFKRMELRHLVVVDDHHKPKACLTRKNLLPWIVDEYVAKRPPRPGPSGPHSPPINQRRTSRHSRHSSRSRRSSKRSSTSTESSSDEEGGWRNIKS